MTTNEEARKALRRLEALHPTARIVVGQQTHGGPLQYGDGCDAHGMWCREWRIVRDSLAVIRDALAAAPDHQAEAPSGHDRDSLGICRRCGAGLTAKDILDGERPCSSGVPSDLTRDALIEGAKLSARNLMRNDPRVWYDALASALDQVLPEFWSAALAARPVVDDAAVVDALTAFYGDERDFWSMKKVRRMRAALAALGGDQ